MGTSEKEGRLASIITWLRRGYGDAGIPAKDYVPLLEVLYRKLTEQEVGEIVQQLVATDDAPFSAEDIAEATRRRVLETPTDEDVMRVAARLAAGGWPLEGFGDAHPA
jgi:hypothetical protein